MREKILLQKPSSLNSVSQIFFVDRRHY